MENLNKDLARKFYNRSKISKYTGWFNLLVSSTIVIALVFFSLDRIKSYTTINNKLSVVNDNLKDLKDCNKNVDEETVKNISSGVENINDKFDTIINSQKLNSSLTSLINNALVLSAFFFLAQIFLKYYKYNIDRADFYMSIHDYLSFSSDVSEMKYDQIISLIRPNDEKLSIPNSPDIKNIVKGS